MKVSIIIQSRGDIKNLKHSISCYSKQSYKKKELILIIDQEFTKSSYNIRLNQLFDSEISFIEKNNIYIFTNLNSDFVHHNVSAMRNFAAQKSTGEYINFMDDDEDFNVDYITNSFEYWKKYRKILRKDFVLTPTLMYRHTGKIQNQGFKKFNYWLSRPSACVLGQKEWARIQMYSGNSLFAPAYIFQQNKMDERFDFVYEDLAYSYGLHKLGIPIVVSKELKIYHMERDKTKLEEAWVGNQIQAYKKAKHRMLFINKFANSWQKIQFYILGFRGQPLWLIIKILLFKTKNKFQIIYNVYRGTIDGLLKK